jgi:hypothetical protein
MFYLSVSVMYKCKLYVQQNESLLLVTQTSINYISSAENTVVDRTNFGEKMFQWSWKWKWNLSLSLVHFFIRKYIPRPAFHHIQTDTHTSNRIWPLWYLDPTKCRRNAKTHTLTHTHTHTMTALACFYSQFTGNTTTITCFFVSIQLP